MVLAAADGILLKVPAALGFNYIVILPSSGQTLALAEPEARLYNHPRTPNPVPEQMFLLAISQPFLNGLS